MRPDDIVAYTYKADMYEPVALIEKMIEVEAIDEELGEDPRDFLPEVTLTELAERRGIDRDDERSFDSDDFPKVVFRDQYEDYKATHLPEE